MMSDVFKLFSFYILNNNKINFLINGEDKLSLIVFYTFRKPKYQNVTLHPGTKCLKETLYVHVELGKYYIIGIIVGLLINYCLRSEPEFLMS